MSDSDTIPTREEYDQLINQADIAHQSAVAARFTARDQLRRADMALDKAWTSFRATYPIKSAAQVHREAIAKKSGAAFGACASRRRSSRFLGERKSEPASPFDAQRIYSKGGNINSGGRGGLQRFGGFGVENRGRVVVQVPSKRAWGSVMMETSVPQSPGKLHRPRPTWPTSVSAMAARLSRV